MLSRLLLPLCLCAAVALADEPRTGQEAPKADPLAEGGAKKEVPPSEVPMPADQLQSFFVIIEGDKGVGSGFIVSNGGGGNSKIAFKLLNGKQVKCSKFEVSATEDLARGTA